MSPEDLDAIRRRIHRAEGAVRDAQGPSYETSFQAEGTDFVTRVRVEGIKSPEQIEDEFLALFIWTWSFKDHLKQCFLARGLRPKDVEDLVNTTPSLCLVADVANRAKHGTLRDSRSGRFAELVEVGFEVPQHGIECIVVAGPSVTVKVRDPALVQIRGLVRTQDGMEWQAIEVLSEAMQAWEAHGIARIAA